ncbi:MAG TPA: DVUA0089 family protein, partial [Tepidisphaeraceae bacterium]|nr:DVUA0089 family protein [Tepidisphaeraceae bacterium]
MRQESHEFSNLQPLERRFLLSSLTATDSDPDDQIPEAVFLGALTQTRSAPNQIDTSTDVDLFSFSIAAGQKISVDIDPTPTSAALDSLLRLFDSAGNQLAQNDNAAAPGGSLTTESFLSYTFPAAGTYYVGVSGNLNTTYSPLTGDSDTPGPTGPYTLILSPGLTGTISGNVGNGNESYIVDIFRHGSANPQPIIADPAQQTWIVIHGRSSSRYSAPTPNIPRLASAILSRRPNDQVLTLDWSGPATPQSGFLFLEEDWIQPVAAWAASALLAYGLSASNINLVGHSWGGNMTDELAERLGGVNTIVAIDPAKDGGGTYNPNANFGTPSAQINFAAHSQFSWAFYSRDGGILGITAGNETTPTSADEAITVTNSEHSKLVNLFSSMLETPAGPV